MVFAQEMFTTVTHELTDTSRIKKRERNLRQLPQAPLEVLPNGAEAIVINKQKF